MITNYMGNMVWNNLELHLNGKDQKRLGWKDIRKRGKNGEP